MKNSQKLPFGILLLSCTYLLSFGAGSRGEFVVYERKIEEKTVRIVKKDIILGRDQYKAQIVQEDKIIQETPYSFISEFTYKTKEKGTFLIALNE